MAIKHKHDSFFLPINKMAAILILFPVSIRDSTRHYIPIYQQLKAVALGLA